MVIVLAGLDAGPEALQALDKGLALVEPLVRDNPGNADLAKRLSGICRAERPTRGWADGFARTSLVDGLPVVERACELWKQLAQDHRNIPELQADYAPCSCTEAIFTISRGRCLPVFDSIRRQTIFSADSSAKARCRPTTESTRR